GFSGVYHAVRLREGIDTGLDVEKRITSKTKAVVPVHYAGASCRIDELLEVAEKNNLYIIEDAAEALGTSYKSKPVGSAGTAAMFSFCGNKVVTTGEGGMVVTDDEEIADALTLLRSHGRTDKGGYFTSSESFDYIALGHNWRMSELTAELGRSQFRKLPLLIEMRQQVAAHYNDLLEGLPVQCPSPLPDSTHIYQMYTVRFRDNRAREAVRKHLTREKIMTKIYFDSVHLTTFYADLGFRKGDLPVTETLSETVLTLPLFPGMDGSEVELVCKEIRKALS
ncbi:MAG: DegT/DnrJ/EryC1/StrS family aminotransferase, partial [Promethearchaeota archaeon]